MIEFQNYLKECYLYVFKEKKILFNILLILLFGISSDHCKKYIETVGTFLAISIQLRVSGLECSVLDAYSSKNSNSPFPHACQAWPRSSQCKLKITRDFTSDLICRWGAQGQSCYHYKWFLIYLHIKEDV